MINPRTIALFSLIIAFVTPLFGMGTNIEEGHDIVDFTQFYEVEGTKNPEGISFKTEELTIQSHDGQEVFSNKRIVKYTFNQSKSKITIKRHVLSSETTKLCEDKTLQELYPDMTSTLLSSILAPKKLKKEHPIKVNVRSTSAELGEGNWLIIDKAIPLQAQKDSFMGVTARFTTATEALNYSSPNSHFLNQLNIVKSDIALEMTNKKGDKHYILLSETITPIR